MLLLVMMPSASATPTLRHHRPFQAPIAVPSPYGALPDNPKPERPNYIVTTVCTGWRAPDGMPLPYIPGAPSLDAALELAGVNTIRPQERQGMRSAQPDVISNLQLGGGPPIVLIDGQRLYDSWIPVPAGATSLQVMEPRSHGAFRGLDRGSVHPL